MQYVTSFERRGMQQGIQQGIQQGFKQGMHLGKVEYARESFVNILNARFSMIPKTLLTTIDGIDTLLTLKELLTHAATCRSLEEFREILLKREEPERTEQSERHEHIESEA